MNKAPGNKRFWHLLGPFFLYWGMEFLGSMLAGMILLLMSVPEVVQSVSWKDSMTNEEMTEAVGQMQSIFLDLISRYQVQMLAVAALCTIPVMALLFYKDRKQEALLQLPVNKKAPLQKYFWILLLGTALCIGGNSLIFMADLTFISEGYQAASSVFYAPSFPVQVLCLGIIVPVSEELVFRGLLFKRCREFVGFIPAAAGISILFGFSHGNLVQFLYAAGLGMLLAYCYEKYGSLRASVLLHVTANLVSLILTETGTFTWICMSFGRLAASVIACAFFGAAAFVMIQRIDEKPENTGSPDGGGYMRGFTEENTKNRPDSLL